MKQRANSQATIAIHGNWLNVDGRTLRADVLPMKGSDGIEIDTEGLRAIIDLGRYAILDGIEEYYGRVRQANPDATVVRPSILTAYLGNSKQTDGRESLVLTPKGYDNGGVIGARDELQEPFRPFWDAILAEGFLPEVRRMSGKQQGGAWLALRRPTFAQVSEYWLDDPYVLPELDADTLYPTIDAPEEFQASNATWIDLRDDSLKYVHASAHERTSTRSRLQISAQLASAAYKYATLLGDPQEDIDDALMYADNTASLAEGTALAIEQAVFE